MGYCNKYKLNFNKYCAPRKEEELEGVLNQFCVTYNTECGAEIPEDEQDMAVESKTIAAKSLQPKDFITATDGIPQPSDDVIIPVKNHSDVIKTSDSELTDILDRKPFSDSGEDDFPKPKTDVIPNTTPDVTTASDKDVTVSENDDFKFGQIDGEGESKKQVFSGPTWEYCMRFASHYRQLCFSDDVGQGDAIEFCGSYKTNCGGPQDAGPTVSEKQKAAIESSDDLEAPDVQAKPTENISKEVLEYCKMYVENYNYFCAGGSEKENEKFCDAYSQNCPNNIGSNFKHSGSFLGGEDSREQSEGRKGNERNREKEHSLYLYEGNKKEYCDKFSVNYEYYCEGGGVNAKITRKFCPSYRTACIMEKEKPAAPANPFKTKAEKPTHRHKHRRHRGRSGHLHRRGKSRRHRHRKKRPCTDDCDPRIFKHCTLSCKCDYAYPAVQKFCNPPPLPLFLNTCRFQSIPHSMLWYNKCPKYQRYHYSSQFVYSKAEKGKKVEGPVNSKPFNVISPSGETIPVVLRQPGVGTRNKREAREDLTLWDSVREPISSQKEAGMVEWTPREERMFHEKMFDFNENDFQTLLRYGPESSKTKTNNLVQWDYAPKSKKKREKKSSKSFQTKSSTPSLVQPPPLPKVTKSKDDFPVVPDDSVFENAVSQYGAFTDTQGILHRPRSRSPFTKPGLWEPNPDNPHNRDHANKWYYRPESVNADWLNGQLAWGAHWAVPAAGVGGTDGFSAVYFPTLGTFLNIPDDYD